MYENIQILGCGKLNLHKNIHLFSYLLYLKKQTVIVIILSIFSGLLGRYRDGEHQQSIP